MYYYVLLYILYIILYIKYKFKNNNLCNKHFNYYKMK